MNNSAALSRPEEFLACGFVRSCTRRVSGKSEQLETRSDETWAGHYTGTVNVLENSERQ